mmetsp:Transcript_59990/g.165900  ORF Transcript_59990/g.165900 Transcript_59990/m.165900 type:complete len:181 (-) Transcript_59990:219-761(-)
MPHQASVAIRSEFLRSCSFSMNSSFWSAASSKSRGFSCKATFKITFAKMRHAPLAQIVASSFHGLKKSRLVRTTQMTSSAVTAIAKSTITSRMIATSPNPSNARGNGRQVIHVIRKTRQRYSKVKTKKPVIAIDGATAEKHIKTAKPNVTSKRSSTYDPPGDRYAYGAMMWHFSWYWSKL